jgi:DNA-binding PadR family transcriptional regulator
MSIKPKPVKRMPPTAGRVLDFLEDNAQTGIADVPQSEIMIATGISTGSLYYALRILEKRRRIEVIHEGGDRRRVSYRMNRPEEGW